MKKLSIIILCLTMYCFGCSWITELAIINKSKNPAIITYFIKSNDKRKEAGILCPSKIFRFSPPRSAPIEKFKERMLDEFQECPYDFDEKSNKITTVILPGKALWVDRTMNWSGQVSEFWFCNMALNKLVIKQPEKEVTYEGLELLEAFDRYHINPFNNTLYAIIIR